MRWGYSQPQSSFVQQVTAQLLSADGRSAATVSKPWVTRRRGWISRYIRQAAAQLQQTRYIVFPGNVHSLPSRFAILVVMCRTLLYLPLYMLGMANPDTDIWVPLFEDYQEQSDIPFAVFQATLQVSQLPC